MDWANALTLCRDLQRGTVSAVDLMNEIYDRIERVNPTVNALVNLLTRDEAVALATQADLVPIAQRGPLHGLPMACKDAVEVAGFATAWGFSPWSTNVAQKDDIQARRLRDAGVLFIGRSNMPEFGLGSHTFNNLFGATLNPYNQDKSPGGSSGGAAVALATRMLPLADGSDMGGSLRNPASFCNVVGFRPSTGRIPNTRGMAWFARLATTGPMATNVADTALLFSIQAGPDPSDPLSLPELGETFLDALVAPPNLSQFKVAYSPTLGGLPIADEVAQVIAQSAVTFTELGAQVIEETPNLEGAMEVFQTQRAAGLANMGWALDESTPDWKQHAKDTAIWNIEKGQALSVKELLASEVLRTKIYTRVSEFFTRYDALILPAAQVAPFDANMQWVEEINGQRMETYIDWMTVCCAITITGLPAISVPAGFTAQGLPVGLQIVGKPQGDLELLKLAHCYELATQHARQLPQISALN